MKTFVLSIPKSIQLYSQKLDVAAILCQNSWNIINEDSSREILLFQKNGNVIDSVNGDISIRTWQFFAQNNSLLINLPENRGILFKFAFYSKDILVLHKDGTNECLLLANENLLDTFGEIALNSSNIEQYLASLDGKKKIDYAKWWIDRENGKKKVLLNPPIPYTPAVVPTDNSQEYYDSYLQGYYDSYMQEQQELMEFRNERNKIIASIQNDKSIIRSNHVQEFIEKYKHCYEKCGVDVGAEHWNDSDGLTEVIDDRINELTSRMQDMLHENS